MEKTPDYSALYRAIEQGDLTRVREFAETYGVPDIEDDYDHQSVLTRACAAGYPEIVRYLLEEEFAYITTRYMPAAFAATEHGHLEVLRVLLEKGLKPDVYCYSKHGSSLIEEALDNKRTDIVRLFVEYGLDLDNYWYLLCLEDYSDDESDEYIKRPAVDCAARYGDPELVELLIEARTDLHGQSPQFYLEQARQNKPRRIEQERREKLQRLLKEAPHSSKALTEALDAGIDVNAVDENGETVLFRFLREARCLNKNKLCIVHQLVLLSDLSHVNNANQKAWDVAKETGDISSMIYLMDRAGILPEPVERIHIQIHHITKKSLEIVSDMLSELLFLLLLTAIVVLPALLIGFLISWFLFKFMH